MSETSPEDLHKLFEQSLNSGDLDALVALYASDELTTRKVVQAGDTALLMGDWQFHGTTSDGGSVSTSGTSIEVACRQSDGSWRYVIDLPFGIG